MRADVEEYIRKSAKEFKRAYPEFVGHTETPGNKKTRVFLDASLLYKSDLPKEVIEYTIQNANEDLKRINRCSFGKSFIAEDGLEYSVDVESRTFDILNIDDKLLYSVIEIISYRWVAYKANIYGIYDGLPVKFGTKEWNEHHYGYIRDLVYLPDEEVV